MAKSEIPGLGGLIARKFFLKLKEAVFSELVVNWDSTAKFRGKEDWYRFMVGVLEQMELSASWLEDLAVREEFDSLVLDALQEFQREARNEPESG
jgi:hypothetical protein